MNYKPRFLYYSGFAIVATFDDIYCAIYEEI